jgi:hypothetical protein
MTSARYFPLRHNINAKTDFRIIPDFTIDKTRHVNYNTVCWGRSCFFRLNPANIPNQLLGIFAAADG